MTDIIIPKKVDLIKSKEMHGHLTIDIHNTRSGFTERYEQHNTVTTAANEFMWLNYLAYLRNGSAQQPTNVQNGIFGGVCLFGDTISGGNMLPLGATPLIGYAGTSTTISGNRGAYNPSESSISTGWANTVWDWGTSQANGTIASVARTNSVIGNGTFSRNSVGPFFTYYKPQDDTSSSYAVIGIDKANEKVYFLNTDGEYRVGPYETSISIEMGTINAYYAPRLESSITDICSTTPSTIFRRWFDVDNQTIYAAVVTTGGTSNDGVITIYSTDVSAVSPAETSTAVTLSGCFLQASTAEGRVPVISNGHIYILGWNPSDTSDYGIYIMDMSDNSVAYYSIKSAITSAGYTYSNAYRMERWKAGGVSVAVILSDSGTTYYKELIVQEDGSFLFEEPGMLSTTNYGNFYTSYPGLGLGNGADAAMAQLYIYSGGTANSEYSRIWLPYDYMATYCNLNSTVTKTSSETMKLTYTLSDS